MNDPTTDRQWSHDATYTIIESAVAAELASTPKEGRRWILDAFNKFADTVREHAGTDFEWMILAASLAEVIAQADPEQYSGGLVGIEMVDQVTGDVIDDPDQDIAGDEYGAAALAAMRMVAAYANDDQDTFDALFNAGAQNGTGPLTLLLLAEMAGQAWINKLARDGELPPPAQEQLAAREAERAAATPPEPHVRTSATGTRYVSLPIDAADQCEQARDTVAPHGTNVAYCLTIYPGGVPGARELHATTAHREIAAGALRSTGGILLCGVQHVEDIKPWQVPHSARTQMNRELRKRRRETGVEWLVIRCWQHHGTHCPTGGDSRG